MKKFLGRQASSAPGIRLRVVSVSFAYAVLCMSLSVCAAASTYNFVGTWSASNSYNVNDVVSYDGSLYINTVQTAPVTTTVQSGGGTNLFDASAIVDNQIILEETGAPVPAGGFQASGFVNVAGASSFVTNITIYVANPWGIAFYDANRNYVAGTYLGTTGYLAAGIPIAVPAGASYVRFWWPNFGAGMGTTPAAAIVNAGTTLQGVYTGYGSGGSIATTSTTPSATPTDLSHWAVFTTTSPTTPAAVATTGPWAGKKMFVLSDSIVWAYPAVAGQLAAAIGAVPSSQGATAPGIDAFPGRAFDGFENGQNGAVYLPVSAAVLQDVDLMVIALGLNQDSSAGIGSVNDAPSLSGTMSAQMRAMLETIMGFKPGMRIIVVGPYQTNRYNVPAGTDGLLGLPDVPATAANAQSIGVTRSINNGMRAVCQLYAIPYVDMFNESGVNFSTSALWLKDGLHPNGLGYSSFYVPFIAAQLNRFAQ